MDLTTTTRTTADGDTFPQTKAPLGDSGEIEVFGSTCYVLFRREGDTAILLDADDMERAIEAFQHHKREVSQPI